MSSRKYLLLILALLVITVSPAAAREDVLTGPMGSVDITATATWDGSAYLYEYVLVNRDTNVGDIHGFVLANPNGGAYFDASNNNDYNNPTFNPSLPTEVMQWMNGQIDKGDTGYFSYRSMCAPDPVGVAALSVNGGTAAAGFTLGMGAPIPEPGSFAVLAGGLLSMTGICVRRVRRK